MEEEDRLELMTTLIEEGKHDEYITSSDMTNLPLVDLQIPFMRART